MCRLLRSRSRSLGLRSGRLHPQHVSQQMQANLGARNYLCTLWPAFISAIVAMGPDAAPIAYDSLAWSLLYALTSAAMPGFQNTPLPHQMIFSSRAEAEETCRRRSIDGTVTPDAISRFSSSRPTRSFIHPTVSWVFWAAGMGFWIIFVAIYVHGLRTVIYVSTDEYWTYAATWYLVAALPTLTEGLVRLVLNNVDVYEPVAEHGVAAQASAAVYNIVAQEPLSAQPNKVGATDQPYEMQDARGWQRGSLLYEHRTFSTGLHTWLHVAHLQLRARPYRLLVDPTPNYIILTVLEFVVFMSRIAIFVWGSAMQGSFLFLIPWDIHLLVVLMFATGTPRALWPNLWKRSRAGADLVVWYKPVL